MHNAYSEFRETMIATGIYPPDEIIADGNIHRFSTNGNNSDNAGWYVLHCDGPIPAGCFGDFRIGNKIIWKPDSFKQCSPAERDFYQAKIAEQKKQAEQVRQETQRKAATEAKKKLDAADSANDQNSYLQKKGVKAVEGLKQKGDLLLVPVLDKTGEVQSVQTIFPDNKKRFLSGGKTSSGFFAIKSKDCETTYVCEGLATGLSIHESTGAAVLCAFNAGNLKAIAKMVRGAYPDKDIVICADNDHKTEGNPGITKGQEAAIATNSKVVFPETKEGISDFNDLHQAEGIEAVKKRILTASISHLPNGIDKESNQDLKTRIKLLCGVSPLDREIELKKISKEHKISLSVLRQQLKGYEKDKQGNREIVSEVEPYPTPVDGNELVQALREHIKSHVIIPIKTSLPISLWILLTYSFYYVRILPILSVVSPEKRCGKTTLLEVIQALSNKGLMASNISPAAVFRVIEKVSPTLLIDEADTSLPGNDELRGVINSGHTRSSAYVIRTNTETLEPERFCTFTPKVLALIGIHRLPDTIQDRSIIVPLRRKLAGEKTVKLGIDFEDNCREIREKCKRWAEDSAELIKAIRPEIPQLNNDRAADNWTPILTIAQIISDECFQEAKEAMLHLLGEDSEDGSVGTKLLQDIKLIFDKRNITQISSDDLVTALVSIKESPWGEFGRSGKPITQKKLADLLKGFGTKPKKIRSGDKTFRGYRVESFNDAFKRYLAATPFQTGTAEQHNKNNSLQEYQAGTRPNAVPVQRQVNILELQKCSSVPVQTPLGGKCQYEVTI